MMNVLLKARYKVIAINLSQDHHSYTCNLPITVWKRFKTFTSLALIKDEFYYQ